MRGGFSLLIDKLRSSYWFVPSIMAVFAIVLGLLMVWLDAGPGRGLLDGLGWYQKAKPDGAHEVLSTIAGSMITVAGVVFSITIVAIAYAASQYGPRILTNFMSDRGNQVTLGTFIATFVYCLVVLRTIRGGDEGEFVPQIAVMVGLLMALYSIAVLIYFIHHVPNSIHINNVVAHIGKALVEAVETHFPEPLGDPPEERESGSIEPTSAEHALADGVEVIEIRAEANGYIEAVDEEALMKVATGEDLVLRLHQSPGNFLFEGDLLVSAWSADGLGDDERRALQRSYSVGRKRTPTQDILFLVDELVEMAARALSTGVNDPYTAITCLDWLGAAAVRMSGRRMNSGRRVDTAGIVRIIGAPQTFAGFVDRGFGRMRQYVARDVNASLHALDTLSAVSARCRKLEYARTLGAEVENLMALAEEQLQGPSLARVREHFGDVRRRMRRAEGE